MSGGVRCGLEFDPPKFAATFRAGRQVDSCQLFEPFCEAFLGFGRRRESTKELATGGEIL